VSAEQIAHAPMHESILWLVAPAETTPLASRSVDLITVAQALHWFDHSRFYDEVRRVGAFDAALCAWTYAAPRMQGTVGEALQRFTFETLAEYWPPERRYVDDEYRSIPFPFERLATPALALDDEWSLHQLVGYMRTWSATSRYVAGRGRDPVIEIEQTLIELWPDPDERKPITWPLIVIAGRVS